MADYFVYIVTNNSGTLYVGVTKRYKTTRLVYYEATSDIQSAIQREEQIKGWLRRKKLEPEWVPKQAAKSKGVTGYDILEVMKRA